MMKIGHGRPQIDAKEYLNRFDLISPIIPRPVSQAQQVSDSARTSLEEVKAAIMADDRIVGDSLHEKVIDMLAKIGEWFNFETRRSHAVEPNSPYFIDVVWLKGDEIDLAAEVHVGGNETEAKDRLRQALRFGARKVMIVSVPSATRRLRSVCQFEPDLKNWLDIWSIPRVYAMYRSGHEFFEDFRSFHKRQRADEITEYL